MEKSTQLRTFKTVVTGPESTGKSTLAEALANHYGSAWVPEYARTYIDQLGRDYIQSDLLAIANGQHQLEISNLSAQHKYLFLDTSFEVLKVWSEWKYKSCDPEILDYLNHQSVDLYLLLTPDIPWETDDQREHPKHREELFSIYKRELDQLHRPYHIISGVKEERLRQAIEVIDSILK